MTMLPTWFLRSRVAETDVRNAAHKAADRTGRTQALVFIDGSGRGVELIEPNQDTPQVGDGTESRRRIRQNLMEALST